MAAGAAVQGTTTYVADQRAGLLTYDVSDPSAPRFLAATRPACSSLKWTIPVG